MADRLDSFRAVALVRRVAPAAARPGTSAVIDVEYGGLIHQVALKRVASARRFTLRVSVTRRDVVLTMPPHGSVKAAAAFAQRHAEWIAQRVGKLQPAIPFVDGTDVPFRGAPHRLEHRPGLRSRVWVEAGSNDGLPRLCVGGPEGRVGHAVSVFLRRQAAADFADAVAASAACVKRTVRGIQLKDTRSRWGSCSARGTLSFSWRLILAPSFVLHYLAAHEVAHLVHMNHSAAFWAVTHRLAPRTGEAEAWLKAHGAGLHRYG